MLEIFSLIVPYRSSSDLLVLIRYADTNGTGY